MTGWGVQGGTRMLGVVRLEAEVMVDERFGR
jgi:hypothetical protein